MVFNASVSLLLTEALIIDEPSEHPPADLDLPGVQVWNVYRAHLERRIGP